MSKKEEHIGQLLEMAGVSPEAQRAHYLAYFILFNQQKFYEAHDVLEHVWLTERSGPNNNFYKALIQLAGAFVHLQKKRMKPALALFRLSRSYLETYPPQHEALDLRAVMALIDTWMDRANLGSSLSPENAPRLTVPAP